MQQVDDTAAAAGRDPASVERLADLFVAMDDDADAARRGALEFFGSTWRHDAEASAEQLLGYVDARCSHLILCPVYGDRTEVAERLLVALG